MVQLTTYDIATQKNHVGDPNYVASDEEHEQKFWRVPLPQCQDNLVPSCSLPILLEFAVQRTYQELCILSELLPKKSDADRKAETVRFAYNTRQLFVRLLAVVKWAKGSDKVDTSTAIASVLDSQSTQFIATADRLSDLARVSLIGARLPAFQVPAAVDVLTLGTYPRLPRCIKDRFIPPSPISDKEQSALLKRLDQVVQYRLVCSCFPLPRRMRAVTVKNGIAKFYVPHEFEAYLTLLGELEATMWTLLKLKILVYDNDAAETNANLAHPLQVHYIQQLVQGRLNTAQRPMDELYRVVHHFCINLQLAILLQKAEKLCKERSTILIEESQPGQRLVVAYWRRDFKDSAALNYRVTIEMDTQSSLSGPLVVTHEPRIGQRLPDLCDYSPHLDLESLLIDTVLIRIRQKLRALQQRLSEPPLGLHSVLTGCAGQDIPTLSMDILEQCTSTEQLRITCSTFTGAVHCTVADLREEDASALRTVEAVIEAAQWHSLLRALSEIRLLLVMQRCRRTAGQLSVVCHDDVCLAPNATLLLDRLSRRRLYLRFRRYQNFSVILEFVAAETVSVRYYLMNTTTIPALSLLAHTDDVASVGPSSCEVLHPLSLAQFDVSVSAFAARACVADGAPAEKRPRMSEMCGFAPGLARVLSLCEQRIPFLLLSEEFSARGVIFQPLYADPLSGAVVLHILALPPLPDCPPERLELFWDHVLHCNVRLNNQRSQLSWVFECQFAQPPLHPVASATGEIPRSRAYQLSVPFAHDSQAKAVDDFFATIANFAHMYALVKPFAIVHQTRMLTFVEVRAYTYHKLVLGYGAHFAYTVMVQYKPIEKQYHVVLGVSGASANPHGAVAPLIQSTLNETKNLAYVVQILHSTAAPWAALRRLGSQPIIVLDGYTEPHTTQFRLVPVALDCVRVAYRNMFFLEVTMLADNQVVIRDVYAAMCTLGAKDKVAKALLPLKGLKAFLTLYHVTRGARAPPLLQSHAIALPRKASSFVAPPLTHSNSAVIQSTNSQPQTPAPVSLQAPSPGGFSLSSPPSLIAPSPLGVMPNSIVTMAGSAVAASPAPAHSGVMSPSPAPMTSLMTPSPAHGFTPAPSPAPGSVQAQQPSPSTALAASPAPSPLARAALANVAATTSDFQPSWATDSVALDSANSASITEPTVEWSQEDGAPHYVTHATLSKICHTPVGLEIAGGCLLERYLGTLYVMRKLEIYLQKSENVADLQVVSGTLQFKYGCFACRIYVDESLVDVRLGLKLTEPSEHWSADDLAVLERYFAQRVMGTKYRECPVYSFLRLLMYGSIRAEPGRPQKPGVLRNFLSIMKHELNPDAENRERRWQVELCFSVPPTHLSILPASAPISQLTPGSPAVTLNKDRQKLLFFMRVFNAKLPSQQAYVPLIYDLQPSPQMRSGWPVTLFGMPTTHAQVSTMQHSPTVLQIQTLLETAQSTGGQCPIWAIAEAFMQNFPMP